MKKVLIVDDVKGWRDYNSNIVQEILKEVEIKTADCAQQAYDILLEGEEFDYILTDMQMEDSFAPKYAGEWLVEQIKTFKNCNRTRVIIISASYNVRHIAQTLNVECIPKPTALKCFSAYQELIK